GVTVAQHDPDSAYCARLYEHPGAGRSGAVIAQIGFRHVELGGSRPGEIYPRRGSRIEAADETVLDMQGTGNGEKDARKAGAEAPEVQAAQINGVGGCGEDDDTIGARDEHPGGTRLAGDDKRFGDRHGAVSAGIEAVDLAARRGLADCPREGLARS